MLDSVMNSGSNRAKYMQSVGTMLPANTDCSAPLQLFENNNPTFDNVKNGSSEQFKTILASFVQELNPEVLAAKKSDKDAGFTEKLLLSVIPSIPDSKAKIDQVFNATKKKAEVGKVVVLHDPVGISQDLAALHGAISISHAHDIMENQYAYMTYQAIETQLGTALTDIGNVLGSQVNTAQSVLDAFDAKVAEKQKRMPPHSHQRYKKETVSNLKSEMSKDELKALSEAYNVVKASKPSKDQEAAVEALNPKFEDARNEISKNSKVIEQAINTAAHYVQQWNNQDGNGTAMRYLNLLKEEIAAQSAFDKVRAAIHILGTLHTMTAGLEASKAGKVQIDSLLYPSMAKEGDMRYPIEAIIKAIASSIIDINDPMGAILAKSYSEMRPAREQILKASNRFLKTLASSAKTSQTFADDVRKMALVSKEGKVFTIKSVVNDIAALHGQEIKLSRKPLGHFVKALNKKNAASGWTDDLLTKFYGSVLKEEISMLTVGDKPHFSLPKATIQGVSGFAFLSVVYGLFVTAPELKRLQSENTARASNIMGLSKFYYTVVMAEVGALALNKNVDVAAAKLTSTLLAKVKIPTNLGINTAPGKIGVAGKALGALKGVLKTTPIIGAFDVVTNYYQMSAYNERNDTNAAFFAGVSIAGGSLLVLSGILGGLATIGVAAGVVAAAPVILIVGAVLAAIGVIGKIFAEDGELETWVTNGFWGWKENWRKIPANYLYWENIDRFQISFIPIDREKLRGFDAQLEIAKLISRVEGQAELPKASQDDVISFMQREMLDYYYQIYTPQFHKNGTSLTIILPSFTAGKSEVEITLIVKEIGNFGGAMDHQTTRKQRHSYNLPDGDPELWSISNNVETLSLNIGKRLVTQAHKIEYHYYPLGKKESIEIIGETVFGFFE